MKVKIKDLASGKIKQMDKRFADILVKMKRAEFVQENETSFKIEDIKIPEAKKEVTLPENFKTEQAKEEAEIKKSEEEKVSVEEKQVSKKETKELVAGTDEKEEIKPRSRSKKQTYETRDMVAE